MRFPASNLPRSVYWFAALAFALRVVARIFYGGINGLWLYGYGFFFDLAQSIAHGRGFSEGGSPTAFRVPLYPIFLAAVTLGHHVAWLVVVAQSVVGALTAVCAASLACRLAPASVASHAATLAAAATAFYPYYVIHDTALEETSLFTLLTIASVLALLRAACDRKPFSGILAGLLLGLDTLTRPTIAPYAALAAVWLICRWRFRAGLACALLAAATVAPWILRNALVMGEPTLCTETGIEFWAGNCGFLFHHYPQQSSDISKTEALNSLSPQDQQDLARISWSEALTDQWFRHKAIAYIRAHPGQTIVDGFRKNMAAFGWLPSPRRGLVMDLVQIFSYGPVMLLGLWGMFRRRAQWRDDSLIYLLFLSFIVVTAAFWAHTSHRSYLDVYWIAFAAVALAQTVLLPRMRRSQDLPTNPASVPSNG